LWEGKLGLNARYISLQLESEEVRKEFSNFQVPSKGQPSKGQLKSTVSALHNIEESDGILSQLCGPLASARTESEWKPGKFKIERVKIKIDESLDRWL
jgi:hypothetical protein